MVGMIESLEVRPTDTDSMLVWCDWLEEEGRDLDAIETYRRQGFYAYHSGLPLEATVDLPGGVKMEFVLIPPGVFWMGSKDDDEHAHDDEKPRHRRLIDRPFYMGKYPVTQEQYQAVIGSNPSHFCNSPDSPRRPVEQVSWHDANKFNKALTELLPDWMRKIGVARLPSEAQWEYACRADTETVFPWGDTCNGTEANCDGRHPFGDVEPGPYRGETSPVGSYKPNRFGLYDMNGNVWEWCRDAWDAEAYKKAPKVEEGEDSDPFESSVAAHGSTSTTPGSVARRTAATASRITATTSVGSESASEGEDSDPFDRSEGVHGGTITDPRNAEARQGCVTSTTSNGMTMSDSGPASEGEYGLPFAHFEGDRGLTASRPSDQPNASAGSDSVTGSEASEPLSEGEDGRPFESSEEVPGTASPGTVGSPTATAARGMAATTPSASAPSSEGEYSDPFESPVAEPGGTIDTVFIRHTDGLTMPRATVTAADSAPSSEDSSRVLRGGSWDYYSLVCRAANRNCFAPGRRNTVMGFRVCIS